MPICHLAKFTIIIAAVASLAIGCESEEPVEPHPDEPQPIAQPAEPAEQPSESGDSESPDIDSPDQPEDDEPKPATALPPVEDAPPEAPDDESEAPQQEDAPDVIELPELADDDIREAASIVAHRYVRPNEGAATAAPYSPPLPHVTAIGINDGEHSPLFDDDFDIRIAIERSDTGDVFSRRLENSKRLAECITRSRGYGELTGDVEDDHPCEPLSEVYDELNAPPAHSATEPQHCSDGCCEFTSSGGRFETLNLRRICFALHDGDPSVEELTFRHHSAVDPDADLWSKTRDFSAAVDRRHDTGDTEALRQHLTAGEPIELILQIENSRRGDKPALYEDSREQMTVDELLQCVFRTSEQQFEKLVDCEVEAMSGLHFSTWNGTKNPILKCEDNCCSSRHGWLSHRTAGITEVCYSEQGPPYHIEQLLITLAN